MEIDDVEIEPSTPGGGIARLSKVQQDMRRSTVLSLSVDHDGEIHTYRS